MHARTPWIMVPENEAAWSAAQRVRACLKGGARRRATNPLFLYGPSGTGKSCLVRSLIDAVVEDDPGRPVRLLQASELATVGDEAPSTNGDIGADLLAIEDVQRLPTRAAGVLLGLLDRAIPRQIQVVLTATVGPALLDRLPARVTSRMAAGLVAGMQPLGPASRQAFLEQAASHRGMTLPPGVQQWLAANLEGTGRRLEGALARIEGAETLDEVKAALREDAEAHAPTVEAIARSVVKYYGVKLTELRGLGRGRGVLLPRQVGMYLARRFTGLPLVRIGEYFGGRDHSTVLHACRKVEQAIGTNAPLSRAVRELSAGLS